MSVPQSKPSNATSGKLGYSKPSTKKSVTKNHQMPNGKGTKVPSTNKDKKQPELEFSFQYLSGGFNGNSVKFAPVEGEDRISIKIPLFGGGEKKTLTVKAAGEYANLVKAYNAGQEQSDEPNGNAVGQELQTKLEQVQDNVSHRVISLLQSLDEQVKQIIIEELS
jgi:hypothetical protein